MTGNAKLSRLYAKDLARSFALPPGRSRGKQAAFAPVRTTLSLVYEAGLTLRPTVSKTVALQLSYSFFPERRAWSGVPCLVRHKMRHAILPFPKPWVPDDHPGRRPLIEIRVRRALATGDQLFRRYGRTNAPSLRLSPLGLSRGTLQRATPARTSALAVGPSPGLTDQRPSGSDV